MVSSRLCVTCSAWQGHFSDSHRPFDSRVRPPPWATTVCFLACWFNVSATPFGWHSDEWTSLVMRFRLFTTVSQQDLQPRKHCHRDTIRDPSMKTSFSFAGRPRRVNHMNFIDGWLHFVLHYWLGWNYLSWISRNLCHSSREFQSNEEKSVRIERGCSTVRGAIGHVRIDLVLDFL